jgi:hypothetical protein
MNTDSFLKLLLVLVTVSEAEFQMLDAGCWLDMRQGGSGAPRAMFKV